MENGETRSNVRNGIEKYTTIGRYILDAAKERENPNFLTSTRVSNIVYRFDLSSINLIRVVRSLASLFLRFGRQIE